MVIFLLAAAAMVRPAQAAGYCRDAGALSQTRQGYKALTAALVASCKIGDTIVLDGYLQAVAIVCDFSKAIVSNGRSVACVMDQPMDVH
jgi:hypothetical protein